MKEEEEDKIMMKNQQEGEDTVMKFPSSPSYIEGGTMRDYQIRGLNWMIDLDSKGLNGILADEMGLGKTLQTISMMAYLKKYEKAFAPSLIIVPKAVIQNWKGEVKKWAPCLNSVLLIGSKAERVSA